MEVRIGLEIHVPLVTKEKLFCRCPADYYSTKEPNLNTCPVCTGMPGAKPFPPNREAIEAAVVIAKLLGCKLSKEVRFLRKHYDYPDLPSGYQRTSQPIGSNGSLNGTRVWEVHLEEDPGRYDLNSGRVDYNRSGAPLVEIVTAPELRSPEEARDFLRKLVRLLEYSERVVRAGGLMRVDANLSLAGGARVEIKNINSVKGAYRALRYELLRQRNLLRRGGAVKRETRGYDEDSMITVPLRLKETVEDYRYIPDPDIPPIDLNQFLDVELPETPEQARERLLSLGVPQRYANALLKEKEVVEFFEECWKKLEGKVSARLLAQWVSREVLRQLNYRGISLGESRLSPDNFSKLMLMLRRQTITEAVTKKLLERIVDTGEDPEAVVRAEELEGIVAEEELRRIAEKVVRENRKAVEDYLAGKKEAMNFLMGKLAKELRGRVDPKVALRLLEELVRG